MKSSLLALMFLVMFFMPFKSEAQYPRTVMLEKFTGTWCIWCPYGEDSLVAILARYPNARAINYHCPQQGGTEPMSTAEGISVKDSLAVTSFPSAAIDRIVWNVGSGTYRFWLDRGTWDIAMRTRLANAPTSPLAINVAGFFDSTNRAITGTVTLNVATAMTGNYYIHIIFTEDDLNYQQAKIDINTNQTFWVNPYYHKLVQRRHITTAQGQQLSATGFTANQVVTYPFNFSMPVAWNYNKVKMTVFVDNKLTLAYGHRNIEQAWQAPLRSALTFAPVQLTAFYAERGTDGISLLWRTASETNNRGWYVERRESEGEWRNVGFVEGHGTTQESQSYTYLDNSAVRGSVYDYRLHQVDNDGSVEFSPVVRVSYFETPATITLHQNYPNPFNPSTDIVVELPEAQSITLAVYDAMGRLVSTLAEGAHTAGYHSFTWNGVDAAGNMAPAGMYYYRLETASGSQFKQMQLVK
jgi:hypothetical protein